MLYLKKKLTDFNKEDYKLITDYLSLGKVLVLPTDTIYGLSCLATDKKAVAKIFALKKRDKNKPLITLVSSLEMAKRYTLIPKYKEEKIKSIYQKETASTFILPARIALPLGVTSLEGNISWRLPKFNFLITIIKSLKTPLVSTSLNVSGFKSQLTVTNLDKIFPGKLKPDLIVDIGPSLRKKPSTIFDYSQEKIKKIR